MQYGLATADHPGLLGTLTGTAPAQLAAIMAATTRFKIGSFTRDIATASGAQAVTGVGFTPKSIIFLVGLAAGATGWSVGVDDDATPSCLYSGHNVVADTMLLSTTFSIGINTGVGNQYQGLVSTFDADGMTISWTKIGVPTGTYSIVYLAFL